MSTGSFPISKFYLLSAGGKKDVTADEGIRQVGIWLLEHYPWKDPLSHSKRAEQSRTRIHLCPPGPFLPYPAVTNLRSECGAFKELKETKCWRMEFELGMVDPLEKGMAHYCILAWRIPWTRLQSMGSQREWTWREWLTQQSQVRPEAGAEARLGTLKLLWRRLDSVLRATRSHLNRLGFRQ